MTNVVPIKKIVNKTRIKKRYFVLLKKYTERIKIGTPSVHVGSRKKIRELG